jgi:hypothetical protein
MMMILDQDKKMIVNIDMSTAVCTNSKKDGNQIWATEPGEKGGAFILGEYQTRERAKQVLQEIFEKMKTTGFDFTYEMPKE